MDSCFVKTDTLKLNFTRGKEIKERDKWKWSKWEGMDEMEMKGVSCKWAKGQGVKGALAKGAWMDLEGVKQTVSEKGYGRKRLEKRNWGKENGERER